MSIEIVINDKSVRLVGSLSVIDMLSALALTAEGCALAINSDIVPRSQWSDVCVNQGDEISLFQAIAGG